MVTLNANNFMALGFFDRQAESLGFTVAAQTTTATTQGATPLIAASFVNGTAHAANGALTLPASPELFEIVVVRNVSSSNVLDVFPATGGYIGALGVDTKLTSGIAANTSTVFLCVDPTAGATRWQAFNASV